MEAQLGGGGEGEKEYEGEYLCLRERESMTLAMHSRTKGLGITNPEDARKRQVPLMSCALGDAS